jgi:hypothetical protein
MQGTAEHVTRNDWLLPWSPYAIFQVPGLLVLRQFKSLGILFVWWWPCIALRILLIRFTLDVTSKPMTDAPRIPWQSE